MADKKQSKKTEQPKEKTFVIPLREKCRVVPRYKKTNKAIKTIKEFLVRHMKIRDRDLKKVKLDTYLNEFLWGRGIKNPPHKVKINAVVENGIVRVSLADMPKKFLNKKLRTEKREKTAADIAAKKKKAAAPVEAPKKEEEKVEEKEKKEAVVEEGKALEKAQHKQAKHTSKKQAASMASQKKNLSR